MDKIATLPTVSELWGIPTDHLMSGSNRVEEIIELDPTTRQVTIRSNGRHLYKTHPMVESEAMISVDYIDRVVTSLQTIDPGSLIKKVPLSLLRSIDWMIAADHYLSCSTDDPMFPRLKDYRSAVRMTLGHLAVSIGPSVVPTLV